MLPSVQWLKNTALLTWHRICYVEKSRPEMRILDFFFFPLVMFSNYAKRWRTIKRERKLEWKNWNFIISSGWWILRLLLTSFDWFAIYFPVFKECKEENDRKRVYEKSFPQIINFLLFLHSGKLFANFFSLIRTEYFERALGKLAVVVSGGAARP